MELQLKTIGLVFYRFYIRGDIKIPLRSNAGVNSKE